MRLVSWLGSHSDFEHRAAGAGEPSPFHPALGRPPSPTSYHPFLNYFPLSPSCLFPHTQHPLYPTPATALPFSNSFMPPNNLSLSGIFLFLPLHSLPLISHASSCMLPSPFTPLPWPAAACPCLFALLPALHSPALPHTTCLPLLFSLPPHATCPQAPLSSPFCMCCWMVRLCRLLFVPCFCCLRHCLFVIPLFRFALDFSFFYMCSFHIGTPCITVSFSFVFCSF